MPLVNPAHNLANRGRGHRHQIFKGKHQVSYAKCKLRLTFLDGLQNLLRFLGVHAVQQIGHRLESGVALARRVAHALQATVQDMGHLLRHLRRELPHLRKPLNRYHLVILAEVVQHLRCPFGVQVRQHQRNGLRMLGVKQLAQLLRVGALQFGQVALRGLLRAPHLHQQIVGALLAEGLHQQAAGIVQPPVHHKSLRLQKLPEILQHLRRKPR